MSSKFSRSYIVDDDKVDDMMEIFLELEAALVSICSINAAGTFASFDVMVVVEYEMHEIANIFEGTFGISMNGIVEALDPYIWHFGLRFFVISRRWRRAAGCNGSGSNVLALLLEMTDGNGGNINSIVTKLRCCDNWPPLTIAEPAFF